jgi:hypothetical protein
MERRYAVILGNLGNTRDRFRNGSKDNPATPEVLKRAPKVPHVTGIELVGPWDIGPGNVSEMRKALKSSSSEAFGAAPAPTAHQARARSQGYGAVPEPPFVLLG